MNGLCCDPNAPVSREQSHQTKRIENLPRSCKISPSAHTPSWRHTALDHLSVIRVLRSQIRTNQFVVGYRVSPGVSGRRSQCETLTGAECLGGWCRLLPLDSSHLNRPVQSYCSPKRSIELICTFFHALNVMARLRWLHRMRATKLPVQAAKARSRSQNWGICASCQRPTKLSQRKEKNLNLRLVEVSFLEFLG